MDIVSSIFPLDAMFLQLQSYYPICFSSKGPKRSPWGGGRPYSNQLSIFNSHGWSNVVFYTPCFCAMDSSIWVPNYSKECELKQVLLPIPKTDISTAKILSSLVLKCSSCWSQFLVLFCGNYRYEHPLLVPEREKSEWVLPITVHAPPPRTSAAQNRGDKLFGLEPSWIRS